MMRLRAEDGLTNVDEEYESAYGYFMITWADTELELYRVLVFYAQVKDAVARAIFSGTRMKAMMDFIKSIDHNAPFDPERSDNLAFVFAQISIIGGMRDHLAHHSSSGYEYTDRPSNRIVTNKRSSRYGKNASFEVGAATLREMANDLIEISIHLAQHYRRRRTFEPWAYPRHDSWSYKARPPINRPDKSPSGVRGSRLQQKSSRG